MVTVNNAAQITISITGSTIHAYTVLSVARAGFVSVVAGSGDVEGVGVGVCPSSYRTGSSCYNYIKRYKFHNIACVVMNSQTVAVMSGARLV